MMTDEERLRPIVTHWMGRGTDADNMLSSLVAAAGGIRADQREKDAGIAGAARASLESVLTTNRAVFEFHVKHTAQDIAAAIRKGGEP